MKESKIEVENSEKNTTRSKFKNRGKPIIFLKYLKICKTDKLTVNALISDNASLKFTSFLPPEKNRAVSLIQVKK